jgi:hypothetical protein
MQFVKKNLISSVEAKGDFLRARISKTHLDELWVILAKPDVTYGEIEAALRSYKTKHPKN